MTMRGFLVAAMLAALASPVHAKPVVWPSDAEARLQEIEDQLIDVQRQRAVARLHNKSDDLEKVEKKFKELQKERVQLLRDTRQLP
jgi:TolA-binding protein